MTWFNILFVTCFCVFLFKNILSWIAGDIDLDVDFDGETDFDVSGLLSFKGILHFLLGFSTTLASYGYVHTHSFITPFHFPFLIYVLAVIVGAITTICLFFLYKIVAKLAQENTNNPDFDNADCKIYLNEGNGKYQVLIDTPNGILKKMAYSDFKYYMPGEQVKIEKDKESNKLFIN